MIAAAPTENVVDDDGRVSTIRRLRRQALPGHVHNGD
jgi:hypothetical protein